MGRWFGGRTRCGAVVAFAGLPKITTGPAAKGKNPQGGFQTPGSPPESNQPSKNPGGRKKTPFVWIGGLLSGVGVCRGLEKSVVLCIWVGSFPALRQPTAQKAWLRSGARVKRPSGTYRAGAASPGRGLENPKIVSPFAGETNFGGLLLGNPPDPPKADPLKKIGAVLRAQSPKAPSARAKHPNGGKFRPSAVPQVWQSENPADFWCCPRGFRRENFPPPPCPKKMSLILAPAERVH